MVIDMLVQPMLYGEICTPGDEPDGSVGHENLVWGMGPMDWDELRRDGRLRRAEDAHAARCNHGMRRTFAPMTRLPCWLPRIDRLGDW
ncbi:MAG: hypothetical protein ACLTYW_03330 [Collinsella sp.]